jgi:hypothetical protein
MKYMEWIWNSAGPLYFRIEPVFWILLWTIGVLWLLGLGRFSTNLAWGLTESIVKAPFVRRIRKAIGDPGFATIVPIVIFGVLAIFVYLVGVVADGATLILSVFRFPGPNQYDLMQEQRDMRDLLALVASAVVYQNQTLMRATEVLDPVVTALTELHRLMELMLANEQALYRDAFLATQVAKDQLNVQVGGCCLLVILTLGLGVARARDVGSSNRDWLKVWNCALCSILLVSGLCFYRLKWEWACESHFTHQVRVVADRVQGKIAMIDPKDRQRIVGGFVGIQEKHEYQGTSLARLVNEYTWKWWGVDYRQLNFGAIGGEVRRKR